MARPDGRGQRDEGRLVALAMHGEDAVAASFAERLDVRAGRLEHAQAEQPKHRDECEVVGVGGAATGGDDRLEL
jgi:hypothetical protein